MESFYLECAHKSEVDVSSYFQSKLNLPSLGSFIMFLLNDILETVYSIGLAWVVWTVITSALLIGWYFWCNSRYVRLVNTIPGPKGIPIIGNVLAVNVNQVGKFRI